VWYLTSPHISSENDAAREFLAEISSTTATEESLMRAGELSFGDEALVLVLFGLPSL
jgi:hypothetical protein